MEIFSTAKIGRLLLVLLLGVALAACAGGKRDDLAAEDEVLDGNPLAGSGEISDPIEGFNRGVFAFNDAVDRAAIKPIARVYRAVLPEPMRDAVRSFLRNIETPVILANDLLQGEFDRAEQTTARFLINSTMGVGGLFDVADQVGIEYHEEDFGQTLATWGVDDGFYVVLPLLGPSSARDAVGTLVDTLLDPFGYIIGPGADSALISTGRSAFDGVDLRSRNIENLDELRADSIDFYARLRSMYHQHRLFLIANGDDPDQLVAPDYFFIDGEDGFSDTFGDDFGDIMDEDFSEPSDATVEIDEEPSDETQATEETIEDKKSSITVDVLGDMDKKD